ncbi:hypothetical protein [Streptomyces sp. NPDC014733]
MFQTKVIAIPVPGKHPVNACLLRADNRSSSTSEHHPAAPRGRDT